MSARLAIALSVAIIGALFAILIQRLDLTPWVGFIAAGCVMQAGGDAGALKRSWLGLMAGTVGGCLTFAIMYALPADSIPWTARALVGVAASLAFVTVISDMPAISLVAAGIYGYAAACSAIFTVLADIRYARLMHIGRTNPAISVALTLTLGAIAGFAITALASKLKSR